MTNEEVRLAIEAATKIVGLGRSGSRASCSRAGGRPCLCRGRSWITRLTRTDGLLSKPEMRLTGCADTDIVLLLVLNDSGRISCDPQNSIADRKRAGRIPSKASEPRDEVAATTRSDSSGWLRRRGRRWIDTRRGAVCKQPAVYAAFGHGSSVALPASYAFFGGHKWYDPIHQDDGSFLIRARRGVNFPNVEPGVFYGLLFEVVHVDDAPIAPAVHGQVVARVFSTVEFAPPAL